MADGSSDFEALSRRIKLAKRTAEPRNAPKPTASHSSLLDGPMGPILDRVESARREAGSGAAHDIALESLVRPDAHLPPEIGLHEDAAINPKTTLEDVITAEIQAIAFRRKRLAAATGGQSPPNAPSPSGSTTQPRRPAPPATDPRQIKSNLVGLALSGGGIRSAAFCLGAVQALAVVKVLDRVDYLSTVSGGGFTGAAVSSTMAQGNGKFAFAESSGSATALPSEIADTPAVGHLRNYSNYLIPNGFQDLASGITVVIRGLIANAVIVFPVLFLLAAVTVFSNPTVASLRVPDFFGIPMDAVAPSETFGVSVFSLVLFFLGFAAWALQRSLPANDNQAETKVWPIRALLLVVAIFFFEFQSYALQVFFRTGSQPHHYLAWLEALLAPLVAIVTIFKDKIVPFLERNKVASDWSQLSKTVGTKMLIFAASFALPVLLWMIYVTLCYWGIVRTEDADHRPHWLATLAMIFGSPSGYDAAGVYLVLAILFGIAAWFLKPNANSLHQLYRDRLGTAFLFHPQADSQGSFPPNDDQKISGLDPTFAPYHLINAAVNLEGSRYLNKRGRNADFFFFSPLFVGSAATGWMPTLAFEDACPKLRLANAVAISGAAVSSNMGAQSIRPLSPTLALLNIRLGYWLDNPSFIQTTSVPGTAGTPSKVATVTKNVASTEAIDNFFLFAEMFGRLSEETPKVYLTDGGHIDNLGLYELLRRECKLIIVIDAEADPLMTFGALISVERYARIDLGVRISLPWQAIQKISLQHTGENLGKTAGVSGPHAALGTIDYGTSTGLLLYIKSSLSGDENDYVLDYARRNTSFPHETTGDQFFSEEQFEAYRALGFHIVQGIFDDVAVAIKGAETGETIKLSGEEIMLAFRACVGLAEP